jgi:2,5-furandicarboxylate decarboxylase 1
MKKKGYFMALVILFLSLVFTQTLANAKVFDDLRDFIEFIEKRGELVTVNKQVSSKYEAPAVQMKCLNETNKAILFTNIDGKGQRMVGNIYGSRQLIAYMFGVEPDKVTEKFLSFKTAKRFPVKFVDQGPCQEIINENFKDVRDVVPIPLNYEKDASFYVTAGIVVAKDPTTGKINASIHRMMYREGRLMNVYFNPASHNLRIFNKYKELKKDMPIAVVIGAGPVMMFGSESGIPYEENEFEYAGALLGRQMEVVKCKTVDLYVPAKGEYILEGFVSWEKTAMEGPMGENEKVYGKQGPNPLVTIKAITHRKNPIYENILGGTFEEHSLMGVPREAKLLEMLRQVSPFVKTVNLLPNVMNCIIQVDDYPPMQRGLGKSILTVALSDPWIKYAIVVNNDVNIYDPHDVNWAVCTRADLSEIVLIKGLRGYSMDPSRKSRTDTVTKIGIDATVDPLEKERFLRPIVIDYQKLILNDYINK